MADSELRDLTEKTVLADTDNLAVQDNATGALQRMSPANVQAKIAPARFPYGLSYDVPASKAGWGTAASTGWTLLHGIRGQDTNVAVSAGQVKGGIFDVRNATFDRVMYEIVTAKSSGNWHICFWDLDADGAPSGAPAYSIQLDGTTAPGAIVATVTEQTIDEGRYFVGGFNPDDGGGGINYEGPLSIVQSSPLAPASSQSTGTLYAPGGTALPNLSGATPFDINEGPPAVGVSNSAN